MSGWGKFWAVMLIVLVFSWGANSFFDAVERPHLSFGVPTWVYAILVVINFIWIAMHIWRGRVP